MNVPNYSKEISKILDKIVGNKSYKESEKIGIVDLVTNILYKRYSTIPIKKIRIIVLILMNLKFHMIPKYEKQEKEHSNDSDIITINASDLYDHDYIESDDDKNCYFDTSNKNKNYHDLINHEYDCSEYNKLYKKRYARIRELKKIPQFEQKSLEWFKQRNNCITATSIAVVLDEDPYKYPIELLLEKCGKGTPFKENEFVHHGKKYEQIGNMFYSFRNNVILGEYGLIQHEKYPFIGASPDGICDKYTQDRKKFSTLVGRLLEIKFPKTRKINTDGELDGDICPHQYYIQCQTQMFVTELDECDFLQCQVEEYNTWEEFVNDAHVEMQGLSGETNLEKGCMIQLLPKKVSDNTDTKMLLYQAKYIYPPKLHMTYGEIEKWIATEVMNFHTNDLSKEYFIDRIIYWRLKKVTCHLIKADHGWFESKVPLIKQFWDYVVFYRNNPKKLDELVNYVNEIGIRNSKTIFSKINKDYLSVYEDSKFKPLYQEKNKWRIKFDEKYSLYKK